MQYTPGNAFTTSCPGFCFYDSGVKSFVRQRRLTGLLTPESFYIVPYYQNDAIDSTLLF